MNDAEDGTVMPAHSGTATMAFRASQRDRMRPSISWRVLVPSGVAGAAQSLEWSLRSSPRSMCS